MSTIFIINALKVITRPHHCYRWIHVRNAPRLVHVTADIVQQPKIDFSCLFGVTNNVCVSKYSQLWLTAETLINNYATEIEADYGFVHGMHDTTTMIYRKRVLLMQYIPYAPNLPNTLRQIYALFDSMKECVNQGSWNKGDLFVKSFLSLRSTMVIRKATQFFVLDEMCKFIEFVKNIARGARIQE